MNYSNEACRLVTAGLNEYLTGGKQRQGQLRREWAAVLQDAGAAPRTAKQAIRAALNGHGVSVPRGPAGPRADAPPEDTRIVNLIAKSGTSVPAQVYKDASYPWPQWRIHLTAFEDLPLYGGTVWLQPPLPCATFVAGGPEECGTPASSGQLYVLPSGGWAMQPICEECARAILALYRSD